MFERLMELNQEAFNGKLYDVAYHALAAALHYARDQEDREAMARVEAVAAQQSDWIDVHASDYAHSTRNTLTRGISDSIFAMLSHQAAAHIKIVSGYSRAKADAEGGE